MYPEYSMEYHKGLIYQNKANTTSNLQPRLKLDYLQKALMYFQLSQNSTNLMIKNNSLLKIHNIHRIIKELEDTVNNGTTC